MWRCVRPVRRKRKYSRKSPTDLGLTVFVMRRKMWLILAITGHTKHTLGRAKLWSRMIDGLLPRAKDFWALCVALHLEPEDFVLSERFLVEKLREYRRQYVAKQIASLHVEGSGAEG